MTPQAQTANATMVEAQSHMRILEGPEGENPVRLRNATYFNLKQTESTVESLEEIRSSVKTMPDEICTRISREKPPVVIPVSVELKTPLGTLKAPPEFIFKAAVGVAIAYLVLNSLGIFPWSGAKQIAQAVMKEATAVQGPVAPDDVYREAHP